MTLEEIVGLAVAAALSAAVVVGGVWGGSIAFDALCRSFEGDDP